MPRAKPNWSWKLSPAVSKTDSSMDDATLEALKKAMPTEATGEEKESMIESCAEYKARYQDRLALSKSEPTTGKTSYDVGQDTKTAEQLAKESADLASKLPEMGGLQFLIAEIMSERGFPCDPVDETQRNFFIQLRNTLEQLSVAADEAINQFQFEFEMGVKKLNPNYELAKDLVFDYVICFNVRPSFQGHRDYKKPSSFIKMLKVMMTHSSGSKKTFASVENVVNESITRLDVDNAFEARKNLR